MADPIRVEVEIPGTILDGLARPTGLHKEGQELLLDRVIVAITEHQERNRPPEPGDWVKRRGSHPDHVEFWRDTIAGIAFFWEFDIDEAEGDVLATCTPVPAHAVDCERVTDMQGPWVDRYLEQIGVIR